MTSITEDRSTLKEFLASIATIKGDLSNITAPPFVLASQSTVEFPAYWAEHPSLFCAPASENDPAKRALAVLRWYLASLKSQQYGGRSPEDGVKKPLNAFLGECFLASWSSEHGKTQLVSEQVSHHPPVTACYLWNEEAGIRAEGYTCQEISFNGSVNIAQVGHAILHVDKWDEDYLIPLPDVKVKGILTGTPYPELHGSYRIVSSSGFLSEIDFSGKGFLSGKKNSVDVAMYQVEENKKTPLYTVSGQWTGTMTLHDASGEEVETIDMDTLTSTPMEVSALDEQDPWESRNAWSGVIDALNHGDMQRTVNEKSKIEEAQREMRKLEESKGLQWEALFFKSSTADPVFEKLAQQTGEELHSDKTVGVWKFNHEKWKDGIKRPFHGSLRPEIGKV